jgi:hypothetical protein
MHRVRIVLMATFSMAALSLATVRPVFMDNLLQGQLRSEAILFFGFAASLLADKVNVLA